MWTMRSSLVLCAVLGLAAAGQLKEEFTWTYISYAMSENTSRCTQAPAEDETIVFPGEPEKTGTGGGGGGYFKFFNRMRSVDEEAASMQNTEYVAENNIPMGTNRYKNRIFITVPRRRLGIPGTLNYVSLDCKARHNVPLTPYPSWEHNSLAGPRPSDPTDVSTPIVSVYRTSVDVCDRLWFVDMGILEYPTGRQQVQQGALVVIDLNTDRVIRRYPFKANEATAMSTLADVRVDVTKDTCDDAYAYIPDLVNYRMIVYSWSQGESWLVNHNYFHLHPRAGEFFIGGFNFQWNDGVFSFALSKVKKDGYRTAYFHAMASTEEFSVSTRILRNQTLATRGYHGQDFTYIGDRGANGQSSTHDMHKPSGVMFLGEVNKNALTCWNTNMPLSKNSYGVIHQDAAKMIYPGDVRVDLEDNVWMMTNSMPVFLYGQLNYQQTNFRIWTSSVKDAIKGTPCQGRR